MEKKASRYDELEFFDVLDPIRPLLNDGRFFINEEGLIERRSRISHDSPWLHAKHDHSRLCALWAQIMFSFYRIVPRGCQNCWKVTTQPRNLKEAFAILELQEQMGMPSKTGMEQREYSGRLGGWSSFWYCPLDGGLEGARKVYDRVSKVLHKTFDGKLKVSLKRACTEMEHRAGPTDKWQYSTGLELKEKLIEAVFAPIEVKEHPSFLKVHIEKQWIKWACAHGDLTYLEYTNGQPLLPSAVIYNGTIHSNLDYGYIERKIEDEHITSGADSNRDERSDNRGSEAGCSGSGDGKSAITLI